MAQVAAGIQAARPGNARSLRNCTQPPSLIGNAGWLFIPHLNSGERYDEGAVHGRATTQPPGRPWRLADADRILALPAPADPRLHRHLPVLCARYGYWTNDVDHDEIFSSVCTSRRSRRLLVPGAGARPLAGWRDPASASRGRCNRTRPSDSPASAFGSFKIRCRHLRTRPPCPDDRTSLDREFDRSAHGRLHPMSPTAVGFAERNVGPHR
jgi:hypothetical protein